MAPPTGTALTGTELSFYQLDKPMFLAQHAVYTIGTGAYWQQTGDLGGATDRTDANYPTTRAKDYNTYLQTSPSTGATVYYFWASLTGAYDLDCGAIMGHNFNSIGATSVSLIFGTDGLFDTGANSYTVKTWASPSAARLGFTSLYHTGSTPMRYSGVTRVAIKVTCGSSQIPRFSEFYVGQRLQFPYKPNVSWDPDGPLVSDVVTVRSDSGSVAKYMRSNGRRRFNAEWSLANTTANQTLIVDRFIPEIQYGVKPFLFWETPYTDERSAYFLHTSQDELAWTLIGPSERTFVLEADEIQPYLVAGAG